MFPFLTHNQHLPAHDYLPRRHRIGLESGSRILWWSRCLRREAGRPSHNSRPAFTSERSDRGSLRGSPLRHSGTSGQMFATSALPPDLRHQSRRGYIFFRAIHSGPGSGVSRNASAINQLRDYYIFKTRYNTLVTVVQSTHSSSRVGGEISGRRGSGCGCACRLCPRCRSRTRGGR